MKNPFKRTAREPTTKAAPSKKRGIYFTSSDGFADCIYAGYTTLADNEIINRCIYIIADLVSDMTIMLMENGKNGDIRIKDELAKKIDINPSQNMTRKTFIHSIVTQVCKDGNCVVYPHTDLNGISDLEILNGCSFGTVGNSRNYYISCGGETYNPDDILHFVLNPDYNYNYRGVGFLPLIRQTIENIAQANATKTSFLKSKWKPSLIISIDTDIEEITDKAKRAKILDSYTSTTEAGEPWLIPSGEIDIKTVQPLTLNDLAIQDSLTLDLKSVASAFGIPPFLLGIGEFKKDAYNNFINTTIMSIATAIQQELTRKLLISPARYFKFNPKSLLQYDLTERMEFVKGMKSLGMLTGNQGRAEFDYSPADVEGMNDYTVLENYLKVSDLAKQNKLVQGGGNTG